MQYDKLPAVPYPSSSHEGPVSRPVENATDKRKTRPLGSMEMEDVDICMDAAVQGYKLRPDGEAFHFPPKDAL